MTSPDTPQPMTVQPVTTQQEASPLAVQQEESGQPETPDDLLEEVLESEGPVTGRENLVLAGSAQLAELVSDAVTATTGVVRIEPTLKNAIVKLTAAAHHIVTGISRTSPHDRPDRYFAVDGVNVVVRDDHVDVSADIVVDSTQPARTTAHLAHTNIDRTIHQAGLIPGRTAIRILVVEHSQATNQ